MATENAAVVEEAAAPVKKKKKQISYFTANKLNRFFLDEDNYIEHQQLDEGVFEEYQDLTSTIKLDREGETTEVDMALGKTRKFLLEKLVVSWNLIGVDDFPIPFSHTKLRELPPHLIGKLVADIYEKNPILSGSDVGKEN